MREDKRLSAEAVALPGAGRSAVRTVDVLEMVEVDVVVVVVDATLLRMDVCVDGVVREKAACSLAPAEERDPPEASCVWSCRAKDTGRGRQKSECCCEPGMQTFRQCVRDAVHFSEKERNEEEVS